MKRGSMEVGHWARQSGALPKEPHRVESALLSEARSRSTVLLTGGLLALLTLTCYLPSFPGTFHFDDYELLLESGRVSGEGLGLVDFLTHYGGRPLTLLTFRVNWLLWGADPLPYHTINVALHLMAVLLFWTLLGNLEIAAPVRFSAAIIFAIHPAQVQAVNYIWSRSMLLMAAFLLLSLLLVRRHPVLSLIVLQAAVWSRAEAIAFVPFLIWARMKDRDTQDTRRGFLQLVPRWFSPNDWGPASRKLLVPLAAMAGANLLGIVLGILREEPAGFGWKHPSLAGYWAQSAVAFWQYVLQLIRPARFSIYHSPETFPCWAVLLGLAGWFTLAALAAAGLTRSGGRTVSAALLWLMLALAPGLLFPNPEPFNESRVYLATAGFAIIIAWAAFHLAKVFCQAPFFRRAGRPAFQWILAALLLPAVLCWTGLTLQRHEVWNSDMAIWAEAVEHQPNDYFSRYNYATALARAHEDEKACFEYRQAVRLNPSDHMSYAGLGFCAEIAGRWPEAAADYRRALALRPGFRYAKEGLDRVTAQITIGGTKP